MYDCTDADYFSSLIQLSVTECVFQDNSSEGGKKVMEMAQKLFQVAFFKNPLVFLFCKWYMSH